MTSTPPEPPEYSDPGGSTPPPPPPPPPSAPTGGGYRPPPGGGYSPPPGGGVLPTQEERTWGMVAHLSGLVAAFVALAFLGPLVVLLLKGNESQFIRRQALEALNFTITAYILGIISALLIFVLIGLILLPLVGIVWVILTIMAGVAANNGQDYRYPFSIRLVK